VLALSHAWAARPPPFASLAFLARADIPGEHNRFLSLPPPHWGGLDLKRDKKGFRARSVERGGAGGKPADWAAGIPSEGKGTWHVARLLQAALGGAREGWEERLIGGAESARRALRCGQRRIPRHQRRKARGLVIAGQGVVDSRWLERYARRR